MTKGTGVGGKGDTDRYASILSHYIQVVLQSIGEEELFSFSF